MQQLKYDPPPSADASLPYELQVEERANYLYARVRAQKITGRDARAYVTQIVQEAVRRGLQRIMVVREIPMMLDAGTLFFAISDLMSLVKAMRIVFVNPYPDLDEDMDFAIRISTNRGADHNVARDIASAERWLMR